MLLPFAIFWSGLFALGNGLERAFFERMQASEASRYITTADLSCTLVHGFVVFVVGLGIALTEDPMYPGMTSWQ